MIHQYQGNTTLSLSKQCLEDIEELFLQYILSLIAFYMFVFQIIITRLSFFYTHLCVYGPFIFTALADQWSNDNRPVKQRDYKK